MILLTGASGFIGKHLLNKLIKLYGQDQIVALTSTPIGGCINLLHNGYTFNDDFFIKNEVAKIHTVIHAGAFTPKSGAEVNNISKSNSNILNTTRLTASFLPNIKNFIFLSTLDVYGYDHPITENSNIEPASLYGHSKLYCEALISSWASQKEINYQILRVGHVYGPGEEKYQKIIPATMAHLLVGNPLQLYGEGSEIRSFIYISDVVDAVLKSLSLKEHVGPINIVGEEQITIQELIRKISNLSETKPKIEKLKASSSTSRDLVFNNKKMKDLLHIPKVPLDEGLNIEWEYMKKL